MSASQQAATGKLLTRKELARELGTSEKSINKMVRNGELPPPISRNARWFRWLASDLTHFLEKLETKRR